MNINKLDADLDWILTATPEQNAAAHAYLMRNAPDLIEAVFGAES